MAIALAASYNVNSTTSDSNALVTPSFTPAVGEVIVIKLCIENNTYSYTAPTGGGLTYTSRVVNAASSNCYVSIFTAVTTSATAMTVSSGAVTGGFCWHSMVVERWTGAQLAATPATSTTRGSASQPNATITTTGTNSIVSIVDGDWSAQAPGTPTYRSSATQDGIHDKSTAVYVAYYAYQTAATAGVQTIGMTSPAGNQTWNMLGIEIQASGTAPAVVPNLMMMGVGI